MKANKYDLVALRQFPRSWTDPVSGTTYPRLFLEGMTIGERKSLGWYEIVDNAPALGDNEESTKLPLNFTGTTIEQDYTVSQDLNLTDLKSAKYAEIWAHGEALNVAAEATFFGNTQSPETIRDRLIKKDANISGKRHKGTALTAAEDIFVDAYDTLTDYQDSVNDIADLAEDAVEAMATEAAVIAYDVAATPVWPVWT